MRYLIQPNFHKEIYARKEYIWHTLKLWMYNYSHNDKFIELKSFPSNFLDICFIVGHDRFISDLLSTQVIVEKYIVIISCKKDLYPALKKMKDKTDKIIYISKQNDYDQSVLYKGEKYGFGYDLTKSEILLHNTSFLKSTIERLDESFIKL